MHLPLVKKLHVAVDAAADGIELNDPHWRLGDRNRRDEITLEVIDSGVSSFSFEPEQSLDGVVWYTAGSAISTAGLTKVQGISAPYFRLRLDAIVNNGESLDVNAC